MADYVGNQVAYGSGSYFVVAITIWDDGANTSGAVTLRYQYRVYFRYSVSDSSNVVSWNDPGGGGTISYNFSVGGGGGNVIPVGGVENAVAVASQYGGGNTAHFAFSVQGIAGVSGTSSITVDYPIPARQYSAPSRPPIGVDSITSSSARIVVSASTDGGGAGIARYDAYVLTNNAWPDGGGNVVSQASVGTFTATGLQKATHYFYTARALSTAGIFSGWADMKVFDTLATVPEQSGVVALSAITQNTIATAFTGSGNGGSGILRWELGYGTSSSAPQTVVQSGGTLTVANLIPGTDYYFWSRGVNAIGNGAWSTRSTAKTLPGVYINVGGVQKNAIPYVCISPGVWKQAIRYVNTGTVWKQ